MTRVAILSLLVLCAIAVSSCGNDDEADDARGSALNETTQSSPPIAAEPDTPPPTEAEPAPEPTGADKFEGTDRDNYEQAEAVCSAFPAEKVASDLGVSSDDPEVIAEAYAKDYRRAFRDAVFEGCLAGLEQAP